jgi:CRP/FNR family cyclic AMP-dependent transcriptional regulator
VSRRPREPVTVTDVAFPSGFLAGLTEPESEQLSALGRRQRFAKGAVLVNQEEIPRRVVVLMTGRVKVSDFSEDGRETLLGARGPGDCVGEIGAADGQPSSATVIALEPVEALAIEAAAFREFLDTHPAVTRRLLQSVLRKLRDADRARVEFGVLDTEARAARRLVELAAEHGRDTGDGVAITLPLTQQDLAGWILASRESVSKALHRMRTRGTIRTDRRCITIVDLPGLRQLAGLSGRTG